MIRYAFVPHNDVIFLSVVIGDPNVIREEHGMIGATGVYVLALECPSLRTVPRNVLEVL